MKYKRVLYSNNFTKEIRNRLRIIKFDKVKSKKNNVFYVYFASESDAEYAMKACKQLQNVTIKPFVSIPSLSTKEKETSTSSSSASSITRTIQPKVKLMTRYLAPNSCEIRQLFESVESCLNAMNVVKCTFDEICEKHQEKNEHNEELLNRLYTQHSTAFYLKMALAIQLKAIFSTNLRLTWSMIATQVNAFERFVDYEQIFIKKVQLNAIHLSKTIDFQSSITMSSKLAFHLVKLAET